MLNSNVQGIIRKGKSNTEPNQNTIIEEFFSNEGDVLDTNVEEIRIDEAGINSANVTEKLDSVNENNTITNYEQVKAKKQVSQIIQQSAPQIPRYQPAQPEQQTQQAQSQPQQVKQPSGIQSERRLIPQLSAGNKMLKRNIVNEHPLEFDIRDKYGKISDKIDRLEDEYGLSSLPLEFCNILPQVTELQRHKIIDVMGTKLTIGTERKVRERELSDYVNQIKDTIEGGDIFDDSLLEERNLGGKSYMLLKFNSYELDTLNSVFLNIYFTTYITPSGDYRINVGGQYV